MAIEFTSENSAKLKEYLTHYPTKQAAVLPALWLAQEQFGYLTMPTIDYIAGLLDLSAVHVYSVATFYTMFHFKPVGRHHLQVCRTLSCALMGAENVVDRLKNKLKIEEGQMTADGRFSLCTVECLASCGTAPMMMVNEKYHENLTADSLDQLLDSLK